MQQSLLVLLFLTIVCVGSNCFGVGRGLKYNKPVLDSQGQGQGVALKRGERPVVPVEQCIVKKDANSGICPQVMKTVCGVDSKKEYNNCCLAVAEGEKQIHRGPCTLPTRNRKRQSQQRKQGSMQMSNGGGGGDFYSQLKEKGVDQE